MVSQHVLGVLKATPRFCGSLAGLIIMTLLLMGYISYSKEITE